MVKNISNSLLLLCLLSFMASCKAKKELVKTEPVPNTTVINTSKKDKLEAIKQSQLDFSTFTARARADLDLDNNQNDVTMHIRIKKDESIWISVTALAGLEVARALITPDSVKIRLNLESTYINKPFNYLYEFADEQINFGTLQAILVGNPIKELITENAEWTVQENQLSGLLKALAYNIQFNERNKVVRTSLEDKAAYQDLQINYDDFLVVSGQEIPHTVNIKSSTEKNTVRVNLKYSRVSLNEAVESPFSVPKRFSVKD